MRIGSSAATSQLHGDEQTLYNLPAAFAEILGGKFADSADPGVDDMVRDTYTGMIKRQERDGNPLLATTNRLWEETTSGTTHYHLNVCNFQMAVFGIVFFMPVSWAVSFRLFMLCIFAFETATVIPKPSPMCELSPDA